MVSCQLFALDCVTFQSDTWKINPAPWTHVAGDTSPSIVPWTVPYLATRPTAQRRGWRENRNDEERREGTEVTHTHTHSYTSCLLMSPNPATFGHKEMTTGAHRLKDWFTNELCQLIYEDSRTGEREKYLPIGWYQKKDETQKGKGADKNTNKWEKWVAERDSWHTVESKAFTQLRRPVMKIQSVMLNWEVSLAMNLLGGLQCHRQRLISTEEREQQNTATLKNYHSASLSLNMTPWLKLFNFHSEVGTQISSQTATGRRQILISSERRN